MQHVVDLEQHHPRSNTDHNMRRRRRALGRDHLDQRGLNAISFQRRDNAFEAADQEPIVSFRQRKTGFRPQHGGAAREGVSQTSGEAPRVRPQTDRALDRSGQ
ncbi:unnamed protein product [Pleuronectes platessa]|uniref:Uncharacterized protein n=1 Tax=Pleuronectes platessa TaxID=8262 RepID=A0A9N7Z4H2_PLEPL|nr:unnamed protein product [Pleuronectes platessa]